MQKQPFPVGGGVKSLRTGEELKNFGTGGGGVTFAGGDQYHITCTGTPSYFKKTTLISI